MAYTVRACAADAALPLPRASLSPHGQTLSRVKNTLHAPARFTSQRKTTKSQKYKAEIIVC